MAALYAPDNLTVVVAPQNVIMTNLEPRARACGVVVETWTSATTTGNLAAWNGAAQKGLLLVSADMATGQVFRDFLAKQFHVFKSVHRLFMDEWHLALQDFRSVMRDLYRICPRPCTWVFLTGSLSEDEERLVGNIVDARPVILRPDRSGFGIGTARPNLEYVVRGLIGSLRMGVRSCIGGGG